MDKNLFLNFKKVYLQLKILNFRNRNGEEQFIRNENLLEDSLQRIYETYSRTTGREEKENETFLSGEGNYKL